MNLNDPIQVARIMWHWDRRRAGREFAPFPTSRTDYIKEAEMLIAACKELEDDV